MKVDRSFSYRAAARQRHDDLAVPCQHRSHSKYRSSHLLNEICVSFAGCDLFHLRSYHSGLAVIYFRAVVFEHFLHYVNVNQIRHVFNHTCLICEYSSGKQWED